MNLGNKILFWNQFTVQTSHKVSDQTWGILYGRLGEVIWSGIRREIENASGK